MPKCPEGETYDRVLKACRPKRKPGKSTSEFSDREEFIEQIRNNTKQEIAKLKKELKQYHDYMKENPGIDHENRRQQIEFENMVKYTEKKLQSLLEEQERF
jgi:hypothetical protein